MPTWFDVGFVANCCWGVGLSADNAEFIPKLLFCSPKHVLGQTFSRSCHNEMGGPAVYTCTAGGGHHKIHLCPAHCCSCTA
eukprot:12055053-Ditylum_brightwellii.AAC.1